MPDNPFAAIGVPPEGASPEAQLDYLGKLVEAFEITEHPRLKPLRKKLNAALKALARGADNNVDPAILAKRFAGDITELQAQTYELLAAVITETRVKLKGQAGLEQAGDVD